MSLVLVSPSKRALSDSQVRILKYLADYKDPETGECTPPLKEIAAAVGLSRQYVSTITNRLARLGWLRIEERWVDYDDDPQCLYRGSNLYKLLVAKSQLVDAYESKPKGSLLRSLVDFLAPLLAPFHLAQETA